MSTITKRLKVTIASIAFLMIVGAVSSQALAQSETGGYQSIVQRLAEKFNLNESEVQAVFDEVHAEHQAQMQEMFEARLGEAVANGDLTEDQKNAILDKKEEMIAFRDSLRDLSPEERKAAFDEKRSELKTWAEEQGIDLNLFHLDGPHGHHHGGFFLR